MKMPVRRLSKSQLRESYPEKGATPGWYFRIRESSANVWLVEGSDVFGRTVRRQGLDEDQLLAECEADAARINEQPKPT